VSFLVLIFLRGCVTFCSMLLRVADCSLGLSEARERLRVAVVAAGDAGFSSREIARAADKSHTWVVRVLRKSRGVSQ
jgi:hypothetical protein